MIVLANEEFATGLRLAGVKNSHIIKSKEQAESLLQKIKIDEFIIATQKVVDMVPILSDFENVIVFPDTIKDFSQIDDLKQVIKEAVGAEVQI